MRSFKEQIKRDIREIFLNTAEFSETHTLNGKEMPVQVDNNEQIEREKRFNQDMNGIYTNQILLYVSVEDYGPLPAQGSRLIFDGTVYLVVDAVDEDGLYSITIQRPKAR